MTISKLSMATTHILVACGLLAPNAFAVDQPNEGPCSNRTLSGAYGFSLQGILFAIPGVILPPGATVQLRGVVMTNFDGKGNFTQVDHVVINGTPPALVWTPGYGTYTVNPNCTGTAVINVPGNPLAPVRVQFVVVKQGKEIYQVVDGNAVTSVGTRVE